MWALRPEVLSQSTAFTDSAVRFLRGPLGMAVRLRCDAMRRLYLFRTRQCAHVNSMLMPVMHEFDLYMACVMA